MPGGGHLFFFPAVVVRREVQYLDYCNFISNFCLCVHVGKSRCPTSPSSASITNSDTMQLQSFVDSLVGNVMRVSVQKLLNADDSNYFDQVSDSHLAVEIMSRAVRKELWGRRRRLMHTAFQVYLRR